MSSKLTCREIWRDLLSPHISSLTLEGILARLGEEGERRLGSLDGQAAAGLRRQLERISRSYLDPQSGAAMLRRFDMLLAAAGIQSEVTTTPAVGIRAINQDPTASGVFRAQDSTTSGSFRISTSSPEESTSKHGRPGAPTKPEPLSFSFRNHQELVVLFPRLRLLLNDFLRDEAAARRLELGLERAARAALEKGGGEIRLEKNAGIRGRLSFQVSGLDGRTYTSGALLASG